MLRDWNVFVREFFLPVAIPLLLIVASAASLARI